MLVYDYTALPTSDCKGGSISSSMRVENSWSMRLLGAFDLGVWGFLNLRPFNPEP